MLLAAGPGAAADRPAVSKEVRALADVDSSRLQVKEGSLKVFEGDEGRRITIVTVLPEASNRVLIKFEGIRGEWDGKTLLHWVQPQGPDTTFYKTSVDGEEWTSVTFNRGGYDVYPKGDHEFAVRYRSKESEPGRRPAASSSSILEGFRGQR